MDPFDFYKDRVLMARLSGASRLGQFTAFTCMEVTAEGRRRGYFDLICGQLVNTPSVKQQNSHKVQQRLREGMLCRILLGTSATGRTKARATQNNLLCLSYIEKHSRYAAKITDVLGLYPISDKNYICPVESPYDRKDFPGNNFPPLPTNYPWGNNERRSPDEFTFVITAAHYTPPSDYIWKCPARVEVGHYPSDERLYTYRCGLEKNGKDFAISFGYDNEYFEAGETCFDQMEEKLADYAVPAVATALGQAKRAVIEKFRTAKKGREDESSEEDSDENDDE